MGSSRDASDVRLPDEFLARGDAPLHGFGRFGWAVSPVICTEAPRRWTVAWVLASAVDAVVRVESGQANPGRRGGASRREHAAPGLQGGVVDRRNMCTGGVGWGRRDVNMLTLVAGVNSSSRLHEESDHEASYTA